MPIRTSRHGPGRIRPSEITPKDVWLDRRTLLRNAGFGLAALAAPAAFWPRLAHARRKFDDLVKLEVDGRRRTDLPRRHHLVQQLLRVRDRKGRSGPLLGRLQAAPVVDPRRGRVREAGRHRLRGPHRLPCDRGAGLPFPLRGGVVDDRSLGGDPARPGARALPADLEGEVRRVRDRVPAGGDAGAAARLPRLALRRGASHRRGDAPPHPACRRYLRRGAPEPERRSGAPRGAVEVRVQEHQVHRLDQLHRDGAADHLEHPGPPRVRLLLQREPGAVPPPLEPGAGAPARRGAVREEDTRRSSSTATRKRSGRSTPAWISSGTTEAGALARAATLGPPPGFRVARRRRYSSPRWSLSRPSRRVSRPGTSGRTPSRPCSTTSGSGRCG